MFRRFRYMIMLAFLLSGSLQALAQIAMPDTVCVGTTRIYGVKGLPGSVYTWWIDGVLQNSTIDSFEKYWDTPGIYKLEVLEYQDNCSGVVQSEMVTIIKLEAKVEGSDVTCYGARNGTINISGPSGGSGNYEYNIGAGWTALTEHINLDPDIYTVQMRDALFPTCVITLGTIEIKEPEPLSASTEYTDASCIGDDGTISVIDPKGGSGSYEYALNGTDWTSSGYFTNLSPGTYVVWISDANVPDCNAIVDTIVIKMPEPLTAKVSHTNVSCFAGNDGTITISDPKNGSGLYQFSIDGINWISGLTFGTLNAGIYSVQMREQNATTCVETIASITITEPEQLQATATQTAISCYGANDGKITVTMPLGGLLGNYRYRLDEGTWQPSGDFKGLVPGSFEVWIGDADAADCKVSLGKFTFTEPLQLTATVIPTDITCFGANDGKIQITNPLNGLAPYQFTITNTTGYTSTNNIGIFTGLGKGVYTVKMRDDKPCEQELGIITIVEPEPLIAEVEHSDETCLGKDGTITFSNPKNSVSGLYNFYIEGHGWSANYTTVSSYIVTGLAAGPYKIMIRDASLISCELELETITIEAPIPLQATAEKTDVTCFGASDGTITVKNQKGGSAFYEYSIDKANDVWINTPLFTGISKGTFTIWMRDKNAIGCEFRIDTKIINQPDQLKATAQAVDVTCFGGSDGKIIFINTSGGSNPVNYEYSINGIDWYPGQIENLPKGIYNTIQMQDALVPTCIVDINQVTISEPPKLIATVTPTNVTCFGGNDGFITITKPTNGKGPYQYSLDGGITWQTDGTFFGLKANTYNLVIVQDANSCKASFEPVVISQPEKLEALAMGTNETSPGANDGTITISSQKGGSGDYEYSIDGSTWQLTTDFTGLAPATYNVQVRDANAEGCLISLPVNIFPAGSLTATFTSANITCYGGNDGSITFANASGTTNYQYSITGGSVWQSIEYFSDLTAQAYTLMVRDADLSTNSTVVGTIEIKQPAILEATVTPTPETFAGSNDGTIIITGQKGGSGEYEYSIDGISWLSTGVITGLTSGTYDVRIRDKNAPVCMITVQKVIQPAGSLSADVTQTSLGCFEDKTGTITISNAMGGSGNFKYSIDKGVTWQLSGNYTGLAEGTYDVMLRDSITPANEISLGKVNIDQPLKLNATLDNYVPPLCFGGSGSVTILAMGGIPPYTGTGTFPIPSGIGDVYKKYTVSDNNGCTAEMTFMISNPEKIVATGVVVPPKCFGENGTVTVSATGGTGTLSGVGTFKVQTGKSYNFKVTDKNGCQSNVISGQMPLGSGKIIVTVIPSIPLCSGGSATVTVSASGGLAPYKGIGTFSVAEGFHSFTVTDANGCSMPGSIDIPLLKDPPNAPTLSVTPPSCDVPTGTITVTDLSPDVFYTLTGTNPVVAAVTNPTGVFDKLTPGVYEVTATNVAGCVSPATPLTVNPAPGAPAAPTASVTTQPTCTQPTGTITVTAPANGLDISYTVTGTNPIVAAVTKATGTFAGLAPGIYAVTTTNAAGCVSPATPLTVNPAPGTPAAPIASVITQPTCTLPIGTITVTAPATGLGISYTVTGTNPIVAAVTNTTGVFDKLTPGVYDVTATNAAGCISPATPLTVNPAPGTPAAPIAGVTNQPTCTLPTGTITVTAPATGSGISYTVTGTNPVVAAVTKATGTFTGLAPGIYAVTTTIDGCASPATPLTVNPVQAAPAAPTASVTTQPTCIQPTGTIVVTVPQEGTGFEYSLDGLPYQASATFASLTPEIIYTIKVKDISTGCESLETTITVDPISANPDVPVAIVIKVPTCNNLDGTLEVTNPTGADFEYSIDGGTYQASAIFPNLKTNRYIFQVRNINTGCVSDTAGLAVPAIPPAPVISLVSSEAAKCYGDSGIIKIEFKYVPDSTYTINYFGGIFNNVIVKGSKASFKALANTTYTNLTIDANGCTSDPIQVTVSQPDSILISESITEIDYKSQRKGAINLTTSGGTGPYTYQWSTGETTSDIKNLSNGDYKVEVTDFNGCIQQKSITIPLPNFPPIATDDEFNDGCGGAKGNLVYNDNGHGIDHDPEKDSIFIDQTPVVSPAHGTIIIFKDGSFEYFALPGYSGTDSLRYAIYDVNHYLGDTASVYIHIVSDFDCDGIPDDIDLDADGDGILNVDEAINGEDWKTADSDNDRHPNWLDIDSDNDGIVDNFEAQSTPGYIAPSGIVNQSGPLIGVDYAYDPAHGGRKIIPADTDGDGIPDFLDTDSDNDGVPDYIEGHDANADGKPDYGLLSGKDSDSDGLDDVFDTVNRYTSPETNMTGSNASMQDFDKDGLKDWRDDNDDGDVYLTRFEDLNMDGDWSNDDIGHPGHPEYLYVGRDCELFIPDAFSPNGDNIHDYYQIYCLESYPNAKIYIFDQLGNKLFEKDHYGNLTTWITPERAWWDGRTNNRSVVTNNGLVPPGTYYYVLDLGNGEVKKSFVFVSY